MKKMKKNIKNFIKIYGNEDKRETNDANECY